MRIKANEYDKVDVMRNNVELDSMIKSLRQELEDVREERNKVKKIGETKYEDNQQLADQHKQISHNQQLKAKENDINLIVNFEDRPMLEDKNKMKQTSQN